MKAVYRNVLRTFLCTGLLLGAGVLTYAQEPTGQQAPPAADTPKSTNAIGAKMSRPRTSKKITVPTATSRSRFDSPS